MENAKLKAVKIEDAQIAFKDFTGTVGDFNQYGNKNFTLILHPDTPIGLVWEKDGKKYEEEEVASWLGMTDAHGFAWNLRPPKTIDENDPDKMYLNVTVSYAKFAPTVIQIVDGTPVPLVAETISTLDTQRILTADVAFTPSYWERATGKGIKAYLKTMYVTVEVDEFASKYNFTHYSGPSLGGDDDAPFEF